MSTSQSNPKPSRPAPFSLRLTTEEREQLEAQAGSMPLASYIKSVVFTDAAPKYRKRTKPTVAEQRLLAEVLAKLGATRSANNLNQIAKAIHQGTLYVDDELEADLNGAIARLLGCA
ncbi:hypothetical protein [uncultured Litoreibacter sp.]|uniref:hypothetical protein n=1 Tax=uncultured Litoreibacter sp. TaxID=1392394 RepID=UPI0026301EB7|nr:hypothetical protein [uncultured Litoreibacter sp.]